MLELSTLENQKILKNVEEISVSTLFQTVLESKRVILKKKQLHLIVQVPENIQVQGDKLLLQQAFSNLIQNAIDFSPAHSEIKLRGQIEGTMLALIVEDDGTGIPAYASGKVFNKFFSLQRPDSGKKSTGLGLNFVQEVVSLHNGKIKLQNLPEKGVRATMMLPLYKP
jgi:two-component system sensor histidine kinase CreC